MTLNNLILIGGGVMRKGETDHIDRWVLERVRKKKNIRSPRVLFIPAASNDLEDYVFDFTNRYQSYNSSVRTLFIVKKKTNHSEINKLFESSDLIYFGGGSAELLLEAFSKFSLESLCDDLVKKGSVICGLSAGAIIWGDKFLTFDRDDENFGNFRLRKGLGWVKTLIIPHFDRVMLKDTMVSKLLKTEINSQVLGIGEGVAAYWENNSKPLFKKNNGLGVGLFGKVKDLEKIYGSRE